MRDSNLSVQKPEPQPRKLRSINALFCISDPMLICQRRAFNKILSTDRARFGAEDDYAIGDNVADDFQQRVDDVVAGTAEVA
jgi:hypothetical protein